MNATTAVFPPTEELYPESDGKPMADNTLQWEWMVVIVEELREQFAGQEVFVAGDLLWYPVEGQPRINAAPAALVALGRPAGHRKSYIQHLEGGVAPQVVFEMLSASNTEDELDAKLEFYERYGVEEYYVLDPAEQLVNAFVRRGARLSPVQKLAGFVSPRLGLHFEWIDGELIIIGQSGRRFQKRLDRVEDLLGNLDEERENLARERRENRRLAAKLRELGIDPEHS